MNRSKVALRLLSGFAVGCVMGFVLSRAYDALKPPELAATRAAIDPDVGSPGRRFTADAGIMLKFIRADKTADFEATVNRLQEALAPKQEPRAPPTGSELASLQGNRACDQRRRRVRVRDRSGRCGRRL